VKTYCSLTNCTSEAEEELCGIVPQEQKKPKQKYCSPPLGFEHWPKGWHLNVFTISLFALLQFPENYW
jgi:hypothetical protein